MVDPQKVTKYNRTVEQLEEFWLFCLFVAGKNAAVQAQKLDNLLQTCNYPRFPLQYLGALAPLCLHEVLRRTRIGQYARLGRAIKESAALGPGALAVTPLEVLEAIHGVGPKTARFFVIHSRPNQQYAALDTHILSWLREQGYKTPKSTPSRRRYAELEAAFLTECAQRNKAPAVFDLEIWNARSKNGLNAKAA